MCPGNGWPADRDFGPLWCQGTCCSCSVRCPQSVHSLDFFTRSSYMRRKDGGSGVTLYREIKPCAFTLSWWHFCFRRVAQPPKLCLFDLDICTLQEAAVNWLEQTKRVNVVGGNLSCALCSNGCFSEGTTCFALLCMWTMRFTSLCYKKKKTL